MIDLHQPKTHLALALISIGLSAPVQTQAALASDALLAFDPFIGSCFVDAGTYPNCFYGTTASVSYFGIDTNSNGTIDEIEKFGLSPGPDGGIILGTTQTASGAHSGAPTGSESPGIDQPSSFAGETGMHLTTSPVTILADDGTGNVTLNFSGWRMLWGGNQEIYDLTLVGSLIEATINCLSTCSSGDLFTLDYNGGVYFPVQNSSIIYSLHLEGTIQQASTVPIPAAAWLFGSGLMGLVGFSRRREH